MLLRPSDVGIFETQELIMRQLEKILVTLQAIGAFVGRAIDRYVETRAISLCPSLRSADARSSRPHEQHDLKDHLKRTVDSSANCFEGCKEAKE